MKRALTMLVLLVAPTALAESPEPDPKALVEEMLLRPLNLRDAKRDRFSRAVMLIQARRVRMVDEAPSRDSDDQVFVRFALDALHGISLEETAPSDENAWRKDDVTGCVYPARREVFVKVGNEYRPASFLLGKRTRPAAAHVCRPHMSDARVEADVESRSGAAHDG